MTYTNVHACRYKGGNYRDIVNKYMYVGKL